MNSRAISCGDFIMMRTHNRIILKDASAGIRKIHTVRILLQMIGYDSASLGMIHIDACKFFQIADAAISNHEPFDRNIVGAYVDDVTALISVDDGVMNAYDAQWFKNTYDSFVIGSAIDFDRICGPGQMDCIRYLSHGTTFANPKHGRVDRHRRQAKQENRE